MPYADLPAFLTAIRSRKGMPARALDFIILTATRAGETLGAMWQEIDVEARTWTIPAERMKGARGHVVPLSGAALAILADLPRKGPSVFPGASQAALLYVLQHTPGGAVMTQDGWSATVHGFRSTFRDWAAENGIGRDLG